MVGKFSAFGILRCQSLFSGKIKSLLVCVKVLKPCQSNWVMGDKIFSRQNIENVFTFPRKQALRFHAKLSPKETLIDLSFTAQSTH